MKPRIVSTFIALIGMAIVLIGCHAGHASGRSLEGVNVQPGVVGKSQVVTVRTVKSPTWAVNVNARSDADATDFGNSEIAFYQKILTSLQLPRIGPVTVDLTYDPDPTGPTGGATESKSLIKITYARVPFDLSVLAHELGHVVQKTVGPSDSDIVFDSTHMNDFEAILEGTANALAALYLNSPRIGDSEFFGAGFDVDRLVSWTNSCSGNSIQCLNAASLTYGFWFRRLLASPEYVKSEPRSAATLRSILASSPTNPVVNQEQPYLTSAALSQVIWNIGKNYGREEAARILVKALSEFKDFRRLENFSAALIRAANEVTASKGLVKDLSDELMARGAGV